MKSDPLRFELLEKRALLAGDLVGDAGAWSLERAEDRVDGRDVGLGQSAGPLSERVSIGFEGFGHDRGAAPEVAFQPGSGRSAFATRVAPAVHPVLLGTARAEAPQIYELRLDARESPQAEPLAATFVASSPVSQPPPASLATSFSVSEPLPTVFTTVSRDSRAPRLSEFSSSPLNAESSPPDTSNPAPNALQQAPTQAPSDLAAVAAAELASDSSTFTSPEPQAVASVAVPQPQSLQAAQYRFVQSGGAATMTPAEPLAQRETTGEVAPLTTPLDESGRWDHEESEVDSLLKNLYAPPSHERSETPTTEGTADPVPGLDATAGMVLLPFGRADGQDPAVLDAAFGELDGLFDVEVAMTPAASAFQAFDFGKVVFAESPTSPPSPEQDGLKPTGQRSEAQATVGFAAAVAGFAGARTYQRLGKARGRNPSRASESK